jgi:chaperonin GroES
MLKPLEDKVIVEPIKEEETQTSSGFIIQRNSDDKPTEGIVVAVGPGIVFPNGTKLEIELNVGDKVTYSKFSGTEVDHEGKTFVILPYRDIFAVIEED